MVDWNAYVRATLGPLTSDAARDVEIIEELANHLQARYVEALASGATEAEAQQAARAELENHEQLVRAVRRRARSQTMPMPMPVPTPPSASGHEPFFRGLPQDIRYAARLLLRSRGFSLAAVLTLALGIGANTAIFTLVDQALLRLLPVTNPQELVLLTSRGWQYGNAWGDGNELSYPMYVDLRDHNQVFTGMLCRFANALHVSAGERTERVSGEFVSGTYFPVLGVAAARGRTIDPSDDAVPGGHPVVALSHSYWQSRFGGDPEIVGKTMSVNNHPMTIIGVVQEGFDGTNPGIATQVYVPIMQLTPVPSGLKDRRMRWLNVFGRLRSGVTPEQAQASLEPFYASRLELEVQEEAFARVSDAEKARFLKGGIDVRPAGHGKSDLRRHLTPPLLILMAVVVSMLLIACANLANLLLARATARQREFAVRLALGASRQRLAQQLLVESLLLALVGGVAGLLLAVWGADVLLRFFAELGRTLTLSASPDLRILTFNFAIAALTGVLFGFAPALQSTRPELTPTLKNEAGSVLGGGYARLRKAFVISQVALSLLLLVGAGLFIRSLHNLRRVDPGFDAARVLSFAVDLGANGYDAARGTAFAKALLERIQGTPGIAAAGFASHALLEGGSWNNFMTVEGRPYDPDQRVRSLNNMISPGYFKAMGIPLVAGRDFDARDARIAAGDGPPQFRVAIANELFVRNYLSGKSALGRHVGFGRNPGTPTPTEIVGVVKDTKYTSIRADFRPHLYFPYLEAPGVGGFTMYVRTQHEPESMIRTLREAVRQLDSTLPIYDVRTLEQQVERSVTIERLVANLSAAFGVLATLLAMIGLYGVMAYTVARRTREIGIRMALGARSDSIGWLVMREVVVLVAIGVSIALPAVWGLDRFVRNQLYGITPTDPATVALATASLAVVAALAGLIPARRASRLNPITALRYE